MGTTTTKATAANLIQITPPPTSTFGTRKEFTTQFGNKLQGLFITWKHEIATATGDVATAKLDIDVIFHWYNNAIESTSSVGVTKKFFWWELMILNPVEEDYFTMLKDAWVSWLSVDSQASTPAGKDTFTIKFVDDTVADNITNKRFALSDWAY